MLSESDDFHDELDEEEDDEDEMEPGQNKFHLHALLVRLHHLGHHVQADQHQDEDQERPFSHHVKEPSLEPILKQEDQRMSEPHDTLKPASVHLSRDKT